MNKVSMLFNYAAADGRAAGWSENWYRDGQPDVVVDKLKTLCFLRAAMLPDTISILGIRVSINVDRADLPHRSFSQSVEFPGTIVRSAQDIPQMALLCKSSSGDALASRNFTLRGIPDRNVASGSFVDRDGLQASFAEFKTYLQNEGFRFRSSNPANPKVQIVSVDADGNFEVGPGLAFAVGSFVTLYRCVDVNKLPVKGVFMVESQVNATKGKFKFWEGFVVKMSGQARISTFGFPAVIAANTRIDRAVTRKVGRPTVVYVGRQRKRR